MAPLEDEEFWAPRRCMREPIPDIFHAATLLNRAVDAHIAADYSAASALFAAADKPSVRAWTDSLWGSRARTPDQAIYHRFRKVATAPLHLAKSERHPTRALNAEGKRAVIERYGRNCAFCGVPLVRNEVRVAISRAYPEAVTWGNTILTQHAAFQCFWMQFDHVLPHSRGGDSSVGNTVVTCAGCNYGRMQWTLEEVGLIDPRTLPIHKTSWDGLERFMHATVRGVYPP